MLLSWRPAGGTFIPKIWTASWVWRLPGSSCPWDEKTRCICNQFGTSCYTSTVKLASASLGLAAHSSLAEDENRTGTTWDNLVSALSAILSVLFYGTIAFGIFLRHTVKSLKSPDLFKKDLPWNFLLDMGLGLWVSNRF